jgi:hypothetical protein
MWSGDRLAFAQLQNLWKNAGHHSVTLQRYFHITCTHDHEAEEKSALARKRQLRRLQLPSPPVKKLVDEAAFDRSDTRNCLAKPNRVMYEYSPLGQKKLRQQTTRGLDQIRCPLDSAMMIVTGGLACRIENGKRVFRSFKGAPRNPAWMVVSVQLECSACRRRIEDLVVNSGEPEATSSDPAFQIIS